MLDPAAGLNVPSLPDATERLAALADRVREELALLDYPLMHWVSPRVGPADEHVYDVVIIGAGQGGLATAFGLRRERVDNILLLRPRSAGSGKVRGRRTRGC